MSEIPASKPSLPSPFQVDLVLPMEISPIRLLHPAHSPSQADIWLVRWQETECVLRDYSPPRSWYWRLLCRWAVRRELHVHRLLDDLPGIPRLLGVVDQDRYLIEFVDGSPLNNRNQHLGTGFFDHLEVITRGMHARGVAHGDLRNKNILVGPGQAPFIIDFSTAWWGTSVWRIPLFVFYKSLDRRRLALSKAKFFPEHFQEQELSQLVKGPFYIRLGRFYRRMVYSMLSPHRRARSGHKR